jgi:hypothetical protein
MRLSNILSPQKYNPVILFPVIYVVVILTICFLPGYNIFSTIDPDAAYYANALAILTGNQIIHIDHPGTPYQFFLACLLVPYRLYLLAANRPFLPGALAAIHPIFIYFRVANSLLVLIGMMLFLQAIWIMSKSKKSVITGFLFFIGSSFVAPRVTGIAPEGMLMFLAGIWFWLIALICTREISYKYLWLLPVISGFGVASKLTFVPFLFTSIFFVMFYYRLPFSAPNFLKKIILLLMAIIVFSGSFITGTLFIYDKYRFIYSWMVSLLTHTGVHGTGNSAVFQFETYRTALYAQMNADPLVFLGIPIVIICMRYRRSAITHSIRIITIPLLGTSVLFLLIFSKYSESYYQLANSMTIFFLVALNFSNKFKRIFLLYAVLGVIAVGRLFFFYFIPLHHASEAQSFIRQYSKNNTSTIWTYLQSSEQAVLFGNAFSDVYAADIDRVYPGIVTMYGTPLKIFTPLRQEADIATYCWKNAFLQSEIMDQFVKEYNNVTPLNVVSSPDKKIFYVSREACPVIRE